MGCTFVVIPALKIIALSGKNTKYIFFERETVSFSSPRGKSAKIQNQHKG
jgi:hypothetical protein